MIAIVDYGMGNLGSVANMLRRLGVPACITGDPVCVARADKLILPGVGAFDQGMRSLGSRGLVDVLRERVLEQGVPLLGICLGMQLLTRGSEEGSLPGLGWFEADTVRFRAPVQSPGSGQTLKIPHMGWKPVAVRKPDTLFKGLEAGARFYFVHSYHVVGDPEDIVAVAEHGDEFVAAIEKDHISGVQFHPEKSHRYGMALLRNFGEG